MADEMTNKTRIAETDAADTTKGDPPELTQPTSPPVGTKMEIALQAGQSTEIRFSKNGVVVGSMYVARVGGLADQIDTGLYAIKDGGVVVAKLWVRKNANSSKTEFWGLSASYAWPSSANPDKTFNFVYSNTSFADETAFKNHCNNEFPNQVVTFLKCDPAAF